MHLGDPIPGLSGGSSEKPNLIIPKSTKKIRYVSGDEFCSVREKSVEDLAVKAQKLMEATPPKVPEFRQSNEFWDSVALLRRPDVQYGDTETFSGDSDSRGNRIRFRRAMRDSNGKEIGSWWKRGFVDPERRLINFSEEIETPDFKKMDKVTVRLDDEGRIKSIEKVDYEDGRVIGSSGIEYSRDRDGDVDRISYSEVDSRGNRIANSSKGKSVRYENPNKTIEDSAASIPPTASEQPAPNQGGGLWRFLKRK